MTDFNQHEHPHRRYNPLLNEWVLVSPHRAKRPWQGQEETVVESPRNEYDETCYLCAGNQRSNGELNPDYSSTYVFDNDFAALSNAAFSVQPTTSKLFQLQPERGINRVVCFSPNHSLTLAEMEVTEILKVVETWKHEFEQLGSLEHINYVQIFENKGAIMGCSNPHPHGQIWAQSSLPSLVQRTQGNLKSYFETNGSDLLSDYLKQEIELKERIVFENEHFVLLVPFWAIWPFETMLISKRNFGAISEMTKEEQVSFAEILKITTVKYDNVFNASFPYSAGMHQCPTDGESHPEWHFHVHFYPPLLRSSTVKKFMVGYELLAEAQRDITPEQSAKLLRELPNIHYKKR